MNTTQLMAATRRLFLGPLNSLIATDEEDLLAHGDAAVKDLMAKLTELQEDYCVAKFRTAAVSGENAFQIPERAFSGTVRHAAWQPSIGTALVDLEWVDFSKRDRYLSQGYPTHFWFENDDIVVNGEPNGYLVLSVMFTPNQLVTSDEYRIVSAVDTPTNTITLTEAPPSTWVVGDEFDIIDSQRGGAPRYWDKKSTAVGGGGLGLDITFDSEIEGTEFGKKAINEGDYISPRLKAGRPMIPEILHHVVSQGICYRAAQATTDVEAFQLAKGSYEQEARDSLQLLDKRARQRKTVINYNSRFRRGRRFRRNML